MAMEPGLLTLNDESLPVLLELSEVLEIGVLTLDRELVVRGWNRWLAAASDLQATRSAARRGARGATSGIRPSCARKP